MTRSLHEKAPAQERLEAVGERLLQVACPIALSRCALQDLAAQLQQADRLDTVLLLGISDGFVELRHHGLRLLCSDLAHIQQDLDQLFFVPSQILAVFIDDDLQSRIGLGIFNFFRFLQSDEVGLIFLLGQPKRAC